jgi:hypothetical protein
MRRAPKGALLALWGGAICYMRETFILKGVWAQHKIYILFGALLG